MAIVSRDDSGSQFRGHREWLEPIPTPGYYAGEALEAFQRLQQLDLVDTAGGAAPALQLTVACLTLLRKFPSQTRREFAEALPFTELERELLSDAAQKSAVVTTQIAHRMLEWVHRSPIFVDESNVHAANFLVKLTPHLDLSRQREAAAVAIERVCSLDDTSDSFYSFTKY